MFTRLGLDFLRLCLWLLLIMMVFVPLERICFLRRQNVFRKGFLIDLGYYFLKRYSDNQLLVSDGETAVIGGLTQTSVTKSKQGIPILDDLPLIGGLFSATSNIEEKQDLLILVTPHILADTDLPPRAAAPTAR